MSVIENFFRDAACCCDTNHPSPLAKISSTVAIVFASIAVALGINLATLSLLNTLLLPPVILFLSAATVATLMPIIFLSTLAALAITGVALVVYRFSRDLW